MRQDGPYLLSGPGPGPVARFIGAVVAALALTLSMIVGFVFFLIVLGVGAVVGSYLWIKLRRLRRQMEPGPDTSDPASTILEGDFEVIDEESIDETWRRGR